MMRDPGHSGVSGSGGTESSGSGGSGSAKTLVGTAAPATGPGNPAESFSSISLIRLSLPNSRSRSTTTSPFSAGGSAARAAASGGAASRIGDGPAAGTRSAAASGGVPPAGRDPVPNFSCRRLSNWRTRDSVMSRKSAIRALSSWMRFISSRVRDVSRSISPWWRSTVSSRSRIWFSSDSRAASYSTTAPLYSFRAPCSLWNSSSIWASLRSDSSRSRRICSSSSFSIFSRRLRFSLSRLVSISLMSAFEWSIASPLGVMAVLLGVASRAGSNRGAAGEDPRIAAGAAYGPASLSAPSVLDRPRAPQSPPPTIARGIFASPSITPGDEAGAPLRKARPPSAAASLYRPRTWGIKYRGP